MTRRPLIYLSYFMFTADLRPGDAAYSETLIRHAHAMRAFGYDGFDLPIAAGSGTDHAAEVEQYRRLADRFAAAGLDGVGFTTNVGATPAFDPTSPDAGTRAAALAYLKSRVEITAVLGGGDTIMAGPFLYPYAAWPSGADGAPLWSDALQDWLAERYPRAVPVFEELAGFAAARGVKLAIEPVDHWEMPGPNMVGEVLAFCGGLSSPQTGATFDTAHIMLGSTGPDQFRRDVATARREGRLHYVHVSPPDRGALTDSWIPWDAMMPVLLPSYAGPYLIEVFNAVPPFAKLMRLTRRRFWVPGEDPPVAGVPSAYDVARDAIEELHRRIDAAAESRGTDDGQ